MIDFYTWGTPNGKKVSIMLEETGLAYTPHAIDISKGEQFAPDFMAISPNAKIPAIVDHEGPDGKPISLFESGAILIYLGEKTGKFLPADPRGRAETIEWVMFQMAGVGPMFGQLHHFLHFAPERVPYGIERYGKESRRYYGVLNQRLADHEFITGTYSIADMVLYPWCAAYTRQEVDVPAEFPHVNRWLKTLAARPAVQRGMAVPA